MNALGTYGMPRTNDNVIRAWQKGQSARNHRHSLTSIAHPSGRTELFSYDLKIGERMSTGAMIIVDFTAPAKGFHSMTTSCHVNLAKCHAVREGAIIMHPKVWECSPLSEDKPF